MPLPIKCKICPVSSVSDFIKQIEGLRSSSCLFRGEADFYGYNFMRAKALRPYSNTSEKPRPVDPFFLKMKDFGRYVKHRLTEDEQNESDVFRVTECLSCACEEALQVLFEELKRGTRLHEILTQENQSTSFNAFNHGTEK